MAAVRLERCRAGFRARRRFRGAFSEFAESRLANRLHETLIARTMDGHLVEHISRDATAIAGAGEGGAEAREAANSEAAQAGAATQGRGAGEGAEPAVVKRATDDEPSADAGGPAEGLRCRQSSATPRAIPPLWIGYKLHDRYRRWRDPRQLHHDVCVDACTPKPWRFKLGTLTAEAGREPLDDLMDAAYDSIEIWAHSILLGHKPTHRREPPSARSKCKRR